LKLGLFLFALRVLFSLHLSVNFQTAPGNVPAAQRVTNERARRLVFLAQLGSTILCPIKDRASLCSSLAFVALMLEDVIFVVISFSEHVLPEPILGWAPLTALPAPLDDFPQEIPVLAQIAPLVRELLPFANQNPFHASFSPCSIFQGKFSDVPGVGQCIDCPRNLYSTGGATVCVPCGPGLYFNLSPFLLHGSYLSSNRQAPLLMF
jgi:hypothetical protein